MIIYHISSKLFHMKQDQRLTKSIPISLSIFTICYTLRQINVTMMMMMMMICSALWDSVHSSYLPTGQRSRLKEAIQIQQ